MTQETIVSEATTQEEGARTGTLESKINAQLNEERLMKDNASVQLSRIKLLDEIAAELGETAEKARLTKVLEEHLAESPDSLVSRYIMGTMQLKAGNLDGMRYMRSLLEEYQKNAKWTILDHIADRILEVEENNRLALRAKVESTERLRGKKELRPYLEKLATIDRKNPDIARKYALSILEEDAEEAMKFLKQAGEAYARLRDYRNLEDVWNLVVTHDHKDLAFFERIERVLVGNREKTRAAAYIVNLVEPYRIAEDWPNVIILLKKILEYEPSSSRARSELVRAYRALYANHSLLEEFLRMSDLTNHKKSVGPCIASFERNIVFDRDNYVYHRTRGVGKINSIDAEQVIIDFKDNPGQKMTIQMAISSLQPLGPNHIWVLNYENPEFLKEVFQTDKIEFCKMLISSFNNSMTLAEIKQEVIPNFLPAEGWSKWWSGVRTLLKKNPEFGFNPRKKDEIILRDTPMKMSEELIMRFQAESDWNKRMELALESLKDQEAENAAEVFLQHYADQEKNKDRLKRIHAFLFLEAAAAYFDDDYEIHHSISRNDILDIFRKEGKEALVALCAETQSAEFKRDIVNLIIKTREDYPEILLEILFEVPIKINRQVISELNRLEQFTTLKSFLKRAFSKYREHPEIFLWAARSILTKQWNYEWIEYNREEILLLIFRLLKPMVQIEKKGTRLKNSAIEAIFGTTNITVESIGQSPLAEVIANADAGTIRRMAAIFRDVPYVPDAHKENLVAYLEEKRPDSVKSDISAEDEEIGTAREETQLLPPDSMILVSKEGLESKKAYLDHLINVEMPANSRDIGEAQEKGDLRENAEYKAAREKQATLQNEITSLHEELKKARIIDSSYLRDGIVTLGCEVMVSINGGEKKNFTILGPWDADTEKNIISYLSPLGRALIGKKVGESARLENQDEYTVHSIQKAL